MIRLESSIAVARYAVYQPGAGDEEVRYVLRHSPHVATAYSVAVADLPMQVVPPLPPKLLRYV